MGAGSSSMACFYRRRDIDVLWYDPDSDQSLALQDAEDGFGRARNKSFRAGSTLHPSMNRRGNLQGELAGCIVFYSGANSKTDYSKKCLEPCFDIKIGSKIFAKAFLNVPMGMMPIGENNLPYKKQGAKEKKYSGFGPVLLAPMVRAVALFVSVNGHAQRNEIFCERSAQADDNMRTIGEANEEFGDDRVPIVSSAIPGSFVTFCPNRIQDTFFFIHLPILNTHEDCLSVEVGNYSLTVANAFHQLFSTLNPGKHEIRVSLQIYYDCREFRYFLLDRNMNARGVWNSGLPNEMLKVPHPDPEMFVSPETPTAEGVFTMKISFNLSKMLDGILDRKVPREKYKGEDAEDVRKEAAVVAMGKFSKMFDVQGLPQLTVLSSDAKQVAERDKDGNKYIFKVVEFVACWVNRDDPSPHALGKMYEGAMAKGQISPSEFTQAWSWHSQKRNGQVIDPEPIEVKNKYITSKQVERINLQKRLLNISKNIVAEEKQS